MAKSTNKIFTVQKRFTINVSRKVNAATFAEAVAIGEKLELDAFVDVPKSSDLYDSEQLPGFGVNEDY